MVQVLIWDCCKVWPWYFTPVWQKDKSFESQKVLENLNRKNWERRLFVPRLQFWIRLTVGVSLFHFCNFSLQVVEQSFSYLKANFAVASKIYFEIFYEKVFKKLLGDRSGKGYDSLCYLFFEFGEDLISFRFKHFDRILKLWIILPNIF